MDFEYYIRLIKNEYRYKYLDAVLLNIGFHQEQVLTQIGQTNDGGYIIGGWSWSGNSGDNCKPFNLTRNSGIHGRLFIPKQKDTRNNHFTQFRTSLKL